MRQCWCSTIAILKSDQACRRPPSSATRARSAFRPPDFYVQEGVYDRFVAGFAEATKKVQVGNGLDAEHHHGPACQ